MRGTHSLTLARTDNLKVKQEMEQDLAWLLMMSVILEKTHQIALYHFANGCITHAFQEWVALNYKKRIACKKKSTPHLSSPVFLQERSFSVWLELSSWLEDAIRSRNFPNH